MCDTLVSLTDHGVLFAKNSDRDPNEAQRLEWHDAARHPAGSTVHTTWTSIAQVERTNAVLLARPWWMWGAEMGANEHGVVIGNEAVFTNEPMSTGPGLLGMDLLRLALERAGSAPEAADVIVTLLERHGQSGPCSAEHPKFTYHNSFLIADPNGAIVVETAGRRCRSQHLERTHDRRVRRGPRRPPTRARRPVRDPPIGDAEACRTGPRRHGPHGGPA